MTSPPGSGARRLPSDEDPLARSFTAWMGGPVGRYARAVRTVLGPLTLLLLVTTATFAVGLVQKAPCVEAGYAERDPTFTHMCYSDVPFLFRERGFAEGYVAYLDSGPHPRLEYPVLTGAWMQVTAWTARLLTHDADPAAGERAQDVDGLQRWLTSPDLMFFGLTVLGLFASALVTVLLLARLRPDRPYDALFVAAAPSLALTSTINWDLLAVAVSTAALFAWSRARPGVAGALIGIGAALKFYPLLLLGPLFVVCWRAHADRRTLARTAGSPAPSMSGEQQRAHDETSDELTAGVATERSPAFAAWWSAFLAAVAAWTAVNLPLLVLAPRSWAAFYTFNEDRGADLGSIWLALGFGEDASGVVNLASAGLFALACAGIAWLGMRAPRPATVGQLALLTIAAFCILNKVYSPQYVLWLLPLMAMVQPRWRDWVIWQGAEAFYWLAVWLHLAGATVPADGGSDQFYALAILIRVSATIYLVSRVVHDILAPRSDVPASGGVSVPLRNDVRQEVAR